MFKINYDALGIAASIACAIHCALLPLVMTSLPILGINIINNYWFEFFMIILALLIGIYSLSHGFKKHHHKKLPMMIFCAGIAMMFLKQVFHTSQIWFLIPGMLLIITAHYVNYRDCRKAAHCHTEDCNH
jgi:hypothetical protein